MTAPDESQMAHCDRCAHRLGSGCGCECCTWAGEAVRVAARAVHRVHDPESWDKGDEPTEWDYEDAREAVQAALPVVRAAATAAERERIIAWLESIAPDYALGKTALVHAADLLRASDD